MHFKTSECASHSDTLLLATLRRCMRAGGAESIFLSSCFPRAGPQVAPHAHSAPRLSGIRSSSFSAWKGQFLGEPSLTNLAFFSLKGKSMRTRIPDPSPHSDPESHRAQAGGASRSPGSAPTRHLVMPGSMLERTGPCRVTLSASLDRLGN